MTENTKDRMAVYEIGYLLSPKVTEESLPAEEAKITKIITDAGASVLASEALHKISLAYEMRLKTTFGSYEKNNEAYFSWIKFELDTSKIEAVKKAVELYPSMLRVLLTTTVKENTYLGKRAALVLGMNNTKKAVAPGVGSVTEEVAPVSVEEMDKSIDEMVKEA